MIRPATPADVSAIVGLVEELAEFEHARDEVQLTDDLLAAALFTEVPTARCLVATSDAEGHAVVGMALWFVSFSTWTGRPGLYLEDLYVRPEHRRAGHGRALLAALAAECVRNGWARLEWSVLDWNTGAIAFYRSIGARPKDEWTTMRIDGDALPTLAQQTR